MKRKKIHIVLVLSGVCMFQMFKKGMVFMLKNIEEYDSLVTKCNKITYFVSLN